MSIIANVALISRNSIVAATWLSSWFAVAAGGENGCWRGGCIAWSRCTVVVAWRWQSYSSHTLLERKNKRSTQAKTDNNTSQRIHRSGENTSQRILTMLYTCKIRVQNPIFTNSWHWALMEFTKQLDILVPESFRVKPFIQATTEEITFLVHLIILLFVCTVYSRLS